MRLANSADFDPSPEAGRSFGSIFNELNRKKRWILLPALLAFICAAAFVNVVKPKYTGEARVLLENRDNYFTRPDKDTRGSEPAIDSEGVQSQVQMVMSRDLALRVIKKLDLASSEEFDSVKKEVSTLRRVLSLLGFAKDPLATSPEERILVNYFERLLVLNVGKSRVISVEFSSRDPELAYKTANAIAEEYIALQRDAKKSTTQGASAWLAQAIEPLRAKVAEAEAKVEAFRAQNGLLIGASNATIATQQLGEMNTQMSNARSMQSDLQAKARIIREALKSGRIFETSEVVNNELVRRLLEQRVAMKTQIALEERSLLPGHPRMKELSAQLNDLESQIRTAAERTARTLENDARVAGARLQSLQTEFEAQKKTSASANEHEVQLRALEREARALRENYEQYLTKYRDSLSRDSDAAAPADARIISRAVLPMLPAFPKKVPIILFSTLATMALAIGIITTRFMFDAEKAPGAAQLPPEAFNQPPQQPMVYQPAGADRPEPVFQEPVTRPPPQAEIYPEPAQPQPAAAPAARWQPPAPARPAAAQPTVAPPRPAPPPVAAAAPEPQIIDPLAPLADDLAALKPAGSGLVIDCRAFGTDVLSSTTALPLARLMASLGRAIVVDCSGATSDFDKAIGQARPAGLSNMLSGAVSFGDIIHRDRRSGLHVIGFGSLAGTPVDAAAPAFIELVDALMHTYDFVLLDVGVALGPLGASAHLAKAIVMVSSRDDSDPLVRSAFEKLNSLRPGCVTIVVEEPTLAAPRPANDQSGRATSAA